MSSKDYFSKRFQKFKKENPEQYVKRTIISNWKHRGVNSENIDLLYLLYLESENCENCGIKYGKIGDGSNSWKCLDHNHKTGLFRNFLCNKCNSCTKDKKKYKIRKDNKTGHENISYVSTRDRYVYAKKLKNGKFKTFSSKNKNIVIKKKEEFENSTEYTSQCKFHPFQ